MIVFISYRKTNRDLVDALAKDIAGLKHEVWFDKELSGGQDWWNSILNSIRRCDVMIAALTPEYFESYPCQLEYKYATDLSKPVIPVVLKDISTIILPYELARIQWVDYLKADKDALINLGGSLNNLSSVLHDLPNPLPTPPPVPISDLNKAREKIDQPTLTKDEQIELVFLLKELLKQPKDAQGALSLLIRLRERRNVLIESVGQEIDATLRNITPPPAAAPKRPDFLPGEVRPSASPQQPRPAPIASRKSFLTIKGHVDHVTGVVFIKQKHVVTVSADNTGFIWNLENGENKQFCDHRSPILDVDYAAQKIITCAENGSVGTYSLRQGDERIKHILGEDWTKSLREWL